MNELTINTEFEKTTLQLQLKNKDELKEQIQKSFSPVFVVLNEQDKKLAKKERARLNNIAKVIDRERIDRISDFTSQFENDCNELKALIKEQSQLFDNEIKAYEKMNFNEEEQVIVNRVERTQDFVINCPTQEVVDKLIAFCKENNCTLTKKGN